MAFPGVVAISVVLASAISVGVSTGVDSAGVDSWLSMTCWSLEAQTKNMMRDCYKS